MLLLLVPQLAICLTDRTNYTKKWGRSNEWYQQSWGGGAYNNTIYGIWAWTDVRGPSPVMKPPAAADAWRAVLAAKTASIISTDVTIVRPTNLVFIFIDTWVYQPLVKPIS